MSNPRLDKLADDLVKAITPDADVKAMARSRDLVRPDGSIPPERVPVVFPWQSRDFFLPGVVTMGASRGGILQFPQGGVVKRIAARARTAPTGGAAEFTLTVNGANSNPPIRISIPADGKMADAVTNHVLPAMSDVALIVSASNGVADVTVTLHVEPRMVTNG